MYCPLPVLCLALSPPFFLSSIFLSSSFCLFDLVSIFFYFYQLWSWGFFSIWSMQTVSSFTFTFFKFDVNIFSDEKKKKNKCDLLLVLFMYYSSTSCFLSLSFYNSRLRVMYECSLHLYIVFFFLTLRTIVDKPLLFSSSSSFEFRFCSSI